MLNEDMDNEKCPSYGEKLCDDCNQTEPRGGSLIRNPRPGREADAAWGRGKIKIISLEEVD